MSKINRIVAGLTKMTDQLKAEIDKQKLVIATRNEEIVSIQKKNASSVRTIGEAKAWLEVLPSVKKG